MLVKKEWNNVAIVRDGSVYVTNQSKGTLGYAFYYQVNGSDKQRKVVTGKSEDVLRQKAEQFLSKVDAECEDKLRRADEEYKESIRPKTFREVGAEWFTAYSTDAKEKGKSFASVESRECSLKAVNKVIGNVPVADIDNSIAVDMMEKCSKKSKDEYYSRSHVDKLQQVMWTSCSKYSVW